MRLPADAGIAEYIRTHLPASPVPGIPEIQLHKAAPASGLRQLADRDPAFATPYWAFHWAGGLALARHVLDHRETVRGQRVLDLGAGSGLVAIAAVHAGAAQVIAAEIDRYAIVALGLNAAENGVAIEIRHEDLTQGAPPSIDIVLVGDLFYAPELATRVTGFLDRCLSIGAQVLVGDPSRADLPTTRLRELARYDVSETSNGTRQSAIFAFC